MTEKEVIMGMLEGKEYTSPDWDEGSHIKYDKTYDARFVFVAPDGSYEPIEPITWQDLKSGEMVEYPHPIPDKTPVWCWDNWDVTSRAIKFWDAKSKRPFCFAGTRQGAYYDHVEPIDLDRQSEEFRTMIAEMQKNLED